MSSRQHHGHAHTPAPLDDSAAQLKWKPMSGAESKQRAKDLRKYAEQRGMLKEVERERKKEEEARQKEEEARKEPAPESPSAGDEQPVCLFFLKGRCNKGQKCKFRHVQPAAAEAEAEAAAKPEVATVDCATLLPTELWLHVLSGCRIVTACSLARCCKLLAAVVAPPALWKQLHESTFGVGTAACTTQPTADAADAPETSNLRRVCCRSEAALLGWTAAARTDGVELPLTQMSCVALCDGVGVSSHADGKSVRLWEGHTGRRLGLRTLKLPSCCLDAARVGTPRSAYDMSGSAAMCVVGDMSGALHALDLEGEIDGPPRWRPFAPRAVSHASRAVCALVLLNNYQHDTGVGPRAHGSVGVGGDEEEEEEEEEEEAEAEAEAEEAAAGRETRGSDGEGVSFCVASAHRDGMLCVSAYDEHGGRSLRFAASLGLDMDGLDMEGALTCHTVHDAEAAGGLVHVAYGADARERALVGLAHGGNALYGVFGGMACAIDVQTGALRWRSGRVAGEVLDLAGATPPLHPAAATVTDADAVDIGDAAADGELAGLAAGVDGLHLPPAAMATHSAPLAAAAAATGARLASYSTGWRLLAVACRSVVNLWDERLPPGHPVAHFESCQRAHTAARGAVGGRADGALSVGNCADGGCVYLDSNLDGVCSGHLLHLPPYPHAPIHVYDIRRCGGIGASSGTTRLTAEHALPPPLLSTIAPSRAECSLSGCFAAGCGGLVAASVGGKTACTLRWPTGSTKGGGIGVGAADDEAEVEAARAAKEARQQQAAAKKKARVVTKSGGYKAKKGGTSCTG